MDNEPSTDDTGYDKQEIMDIVCDKIIEDGKSLRQICLDKDLPAARTIHRWVNEDDRLCQQYARAEHERGDYWEDKAMDYAEDMDIEAPHKRILVDQCNRRAGVLNNKYNPKTLTEHSGNIDTTVTVNIGIAPPPEGE